MKLTKAQRRYLETAIDDVTLVIGGIDSTPNIRRDVVYRLAEMGLLEFIAPHSMYAESEWKPTEKANSVLIKSNGRRK